MDVPCQKFSSIGLASAVALSIRWQTDVLYIYMGRPIQLYFIWQPWLHLKEIWECKKQIARKTHPPQPYLNADADKNCDVTI